VDFVATFIAESTASHAQDASGAPSIYNLTGDGPDLGRIITLLKGRYPLKTTPPSEWRARVAALPETHRAFAIREQLMRMDFYGTPSPCPTNARAREEAERRGLAWPEEAVTEAELLQIVRYLESVGYLPEPGSR
jgi:hypothetical protein